MFRRSLLLFAILAISFPLYPQEETPAPDASEKEESNLIKTGTVVSASATSEKPAVSSPYGDQQNSSPCWVEVTVKPDAGRSVSIHDYVLTADGSEYPCVAVALDGDSYSGDTWKLEQMDGSKNFKMLFPVPSKDKEYKIKFKLLPTSLAPVKLKFSAPTEENK